MQTGRSIGRADSLPSKYETDAKTPVLNQKSK